MGKLSAALEKWEAIGIKDGLMEVYKADFGNNLYALSTFYVAILSYIKLRTAAAPAIVLFLAGVVYKDLFPALPSWAAYLSLVTLVTIVTVAAFKE